jgi:5-methylcytosine-specific restriction protein B
MRSHLDPTKRPVYECARRFAEVGLRRDSSLFTPDRSVWSTSVLTDLYERFNLSPDESSDKFEDKFRRQLDDAPTQTIQLAAELIFIHFLIALDIGGAAKHRLVDLVCSWASEPISIPVDLQPAFATGVCSTGVAFKTRRPNQLWFLIDMTRAWKVLPESDRERLLTDPWACKEFVESIPQKAAYVQRQGLLHLLFPETFEDIVSRDQKSLIVKAFADQVPVTLPDDVDRALALIREQLAETYGDDFVFYDSPLTERWLPSPKAQPRPASPEEKARRAWLLRGTEDNRTLVPDWLAGGYCSIGWPELGEIPVDMDRADLIERPTRSTKTAPFEPQPA